MKTGLIILGMILSANMATAECDAVPGTDSLFRPGVAILLGEIHGTNEGPATAAALACEAARLGYGVTVGLEIPITEEECLDRYMASEGSAAGGTHHIEGIGLGYIPPLLEQDLCDEARGIDETESRDMTRRLAKEEGIFFGTSTGLNIVGAIQLAQQLGPDHTVVTVAVDSGLKYLDGDLYAD